MESPMSKEEMSMSMDGDGSGTGGATGGRVTILDNNAPRVTNTITKSSSPLSTSPEDETFISGEKLINAVDLDGWDSLISRGGNNGSTSNTGGGGNRWERESLYLKFDPMLSKSTSISSPGGGGIGGCGDKPVAVAADDTTGVSSNLTLTKKILQGIPESPEKMSMDEENDGIRFMTQQTDIPLKDEMVGNLVELGSPETDVSSFSQGILTKDKEPVGMGKELFELESSSTGRPFVRDAFLESSEEMEKKNSTSTRSNRKMLDNMRTFEELNCFLVSDSSGGTAKREEDRINLREYVATLSLEVLDLQRSLSVANNETRIAVMERDQALEDLRNVEAAFSDVHRKYERTKAALDSVKKNEQIMKQRDAELTEKLEMKDKKIGQLKKEAETSLDRVYSDYNLKIQNAETESQKLKALLRKHEMKINSLEKDLEQKVAENAELNALCDELIKGKS